MNKKFIAIQKYLDSLHKARMEVIESFGIPKLFFKKKQKASGILAVKPEKK